ncbi:hypothetical protein RDI58_001158 [Solanum bulbocastanum]
MSITIDLFGPAIT